MRTLLTSGRELYTSEQLEDCCVNKVRSIATDVTASCAAAVQDALCEVAH
jgi:hypothetical protein